MAGLGNGFRTGMVLLGILLLGIGAMVYRLLSYESPTEKRQKRGVKKQRKLAWKEQEKKEKYASGGWD